MTTRQINLLQSKRSLRTIYKKNKDYGDAFSEYGTIDVLVRIGDKLEECNLLPNGVNLVEDERLRDTLIDLHIMLPWLLLYEK